MFDCFRGALDDVFLFYPRLDCLVFGVFIVLRVEEFADGLSIVEFLNVVFGLDLEHGMMRLMDFGLEAAVADINIDLIQAFPTNSYHFLFAMMAFDVLVDRCINLFFHLWDCYSLSHGFYFCWL